ncbi:EAL domain-containing protein [Luteibacter sp. 3190]|uniref:EAL domain-containing protein n=1 Tax=Luteibacter sp. 3190 TaxID=2817736 RepID=UPI0028575C18|nr:EAL domain-containing protein [Luteibacter sp. 3190]MDR6935673.1 EAL domain-containing protein (putative c-di-GMP-specific phosphodiesterase class I) [Luteibacter sp. 3190]
MTGLGCKGCGNADEVARGITMAFHPIVDVPAHAVFAHEALVRGLGGETAAQVIEHVGQDNRYAFDQACRMVAIRTAARVGPPALLSINFMPNAVYNPEHCLQATFAAAREADWPLERVIFEVTEHEEVIDHDHLVRVLAAYKAHGFLTAIDDFGAGFAGMNLLADFQPDLVKLDIGLIRRIDGSRPRQMIVRHMAALCGELGVQVIAEGVETEGECRALLDLGIRLQQGFFFARPLTGGLPDIHWPEAGHSHG